MNDIQIYGRNKSMLSVRDVIEMFGCSQSSLKNNFNRTAESIKKKYDVQLYKSKDRRGKVFYFIIENNQRAKTIFQEKNNIFVTIQSLSFAAFEFCLFLVLSASPRCVFRGSRKQLLEYIGVKNIKRNIQMLNEVIQDLVKKDHIIFNQDEDYIILYLKRKIQRQNEVTIQMLQQCKKIADDNNSSFKRFVNLIQVWEAFKICQKNQPFRYAELAKITGLSYKQLREIKKNLQKNDVFLTSRVGTYLNCIGMNVDMNAFKD